MRYIATGAIATALAIGTIALTSGGSGPTIANIFMAVNGSDTGDACVRYTSLTAFPSDHTTVCKTFAKAYSLAQPGDYVAMAGGTYPGETPSYTLGASKPAVGAAHCDWTVNDSLTNPHNDLSGCITFDPAPGDSVTMNGLTLNIPYVRVRNITFDQGSLIMGASPNAPGETCANFHAHDQIADGVTITNATLNMAGDHIVFQNGLINFGDTDLPANGGVEKAAHIRECLDLDNSVTSRSYMGLINNRIQNLIQVGGALALHLEAFHLEAGQHVLADRNIFYNNAGHNFSSECQLFETCHDWRITNNFFDAICSHQALDPVMGTGGTGTCTSQGSEDIACRFNIVDVVQSFNTFYAHGPFFEEGTGGCDISGTFQFFGNISQSPLSNFHCSVYQGFGVDFQYNAWYEAGNPANGIIQCGSTNVASGPSGFIDPLNGNLHIDSTSSANNIVPTSITGGCPLLDIDAQSRPINTNCDAGADER